MFHANAIAHVKTSDGGKLTVIYNFTSTTGRPSCGLALGTNGNFYGATFNGGTGTACIGGCGTVFELTPSGKLTILWDFEGGNDGENPQLWAHRRHGWELLWNKILAVALTHLEPYTNSRPPVS
jgi:uncharacterized repeat protein (TIGR03803 family)